MGDGIGNFDAWLLVQLRVPTVDSGSKYAGYFQVRLSDHGGKIERALRINKARIVDPLSEGGRQASNQRIVANVVVAEGRRQVAAIVQCGYIGEVEIVEEVTH